MLLLFFLLMGVWKCFFPPSSVFTSTASCGPSSSNHSSWGSPTHPFSHEPQHCHTVNRHGEIPLQRDREWKEQNGGMWGMWAHSHICQPIEKLALEPSPIMLKFIWQAAKVQHLPVSMHLGVCVLVTDLLFFSEGHECQWLHGFILQNSSKLLILHVLWDLKKNAVQ